MKKLLTGFVAAMMAASMAACGGSGAASSQPASSEAPSSQAASSEAASSSQAAAAEPEFVFRYAENQPQDYPTTQGAYKFAELVEQKTNGRIKIEIYYGAQLGDEKSVMEQMQFGAIDFARVSLSPLAEFAPQLNVLQLPFLYRDGAHMWKVLEGPIGDEFKDGLGESGLIGLSWYDAGARNFYNSKREVKTFEDMKGLNIRVQENEMMMDMISALGANPTPMAYGEVYSALQTGTIDGAENNWPSYESTSHYEVAKYFSIDEHTRVPELQIISKMTMDKLSPEDQQIIRECAEESAKVERELWAEREKTSEEKVKAGGSIITELSPEEKQKFQDACKPLYEKFAADYMDIVNKIIETK
ncbi:TRAP transporter substrate-binding protein [Marasmitruncus massiliensis]|uniref:TRAP transporter substrate-binding protein n=1 Tax=Marasmitruncus massiliensis TaxID=1944642 RepID=UPI001FA8DA17|nr:TRAP transporter substrate-binding protein [Marasmitruncus massiliensis]